MKRLLIVLALATLAIPANAQNIRQIISDADSLQIVHAIHHPAVVFQSPDSSSAITARLKVGQGLIAYQVQNDWYAVANERGHLGWIPIDDVRKEPSAYAIARSQMSGLSDHDSYLASIKSKNLSDLTTRELEMLRYDLQLDTNRKTAGISTAVYIVAGAVAGLVVANVIMYNQMTSAIE